MTERDIKNAKDLAVREGREEGRQQGLEEGRAEGKAEGKAEVARNMLDSGLEISLISKCTGLSEEAIRAL
ncbi:MAG: hypothetical protein MJY46_05095, partial [Bacteroidales bacterium]|nr:hypothetical protein [Bacteroidales bacterium]